MPQAMNQQAMKPPHGLRGLVDYPISHEIVEERRCSIPNMFVIGKLVLAMLAMAIIMLAGSSNTTTTSLAAAIACQRM